MPLFLCLNAQNWLNHVISVSKIFGKMELRRLLFLPILILFLNSSYVEANPYIDSLKRLEQITPNDSLLFEIQKKIAVAYKDSAFSISMKYWKKALSTAEKERNRSQMAHAYHHIGYMLYRQGEFPEALSKQKNALALYEYVGNIQETGRVYNDIGLIYKTWGRYDKALENYTLALTHFDSIHDTKGWALIANNIGQIYYYKADYKRAIQHFSHYLKYSEENQLLRYVADASNNIAASYMEIMNYDEAETYYNKARGIYDSLGIDLGIAILDDNIGILYAKRKDFNRALIYHHNALEILTRLGSEARMAHVQKNLGYANVKLKRLSNAITYLTKSEAIAKKYNLPELLKDIYQLLSEAYSETEQYNDALKYYTQYVSIKDSLNTLEVSQKLSSLEARNEESKISRELTIIQSQLEQQRAFAYILGGIMILFVFIIVFFIKDSHRIKNRLSIYQEFIKELTGALSTERVLHNISDESVNTFPKIIHIPNKTLGGKRVLITFKNESIKVELFFIITFESIVFEPNLIKALVISWLNDCLNKNTTIDLIQIVGLIRTKLIHLTRINNKSKVKAEINALLINNDKLIYTGSNIIWAIISGKLVKFDKNNLLTYSTRQVDALYLVAVPTFKYDDNILAEQFSILERTIESVYEDKLDDQEKVIKSTIKLMQESKGIDIVIAMLAR